MKVLMGVDMVELETRVAKSCDLRRYLLLDLMPYRLA